MSLCFSVWNMLRGDCSCSSSSRSQARFGRERSPERARRTMKVHKHAQPRAMRSGYAPGRSGRLENLEGIRFLCGGQ